MLVYTTLAACAVLTAVIVYRYDLHSKEPWPLLLLAAALGAAGMWIAGRAQVGVLRWGGSVAARDWNLAMAGVAATTEELAKVLSVAVIALLFRRWFDEPLDGLIYGAFAGLGAAVQESVVHLAGLEPLQSLPANEPIRLAGHLVMGGIGGYGLGMAVVWRRAWPAALAGTWTAAVLLHFSWDLVAFAALDAGHMTPRLKAFAIVLMVAGLLVFRWFVAAGSALGPAPAPTAAGAQ